MAIRLFSPRGDLLLTVDSPGALDPPWPPEEAHWVAEATGVYHVEAALLGGAAGPCALRVAARRPASRLDRSRAEAEAELARAHAARLSGDKVRCGGAVAEYRRAEGRFASLGLPDRRGEALYGLGLLEMNCLGDERAALRALSRAAPLLAAADGTEANIRQRLGELHAALGETVDAIRDYQLALALRQRTGSIAGEALAANNLALRLHLVGRYDEAAALFDRALELWREAECPSPMVKGARPVPAGGPGLETGQRRPAAGRQGPARGLPGVCPPERGLGAAPRLRGHADTLLNRGHLDRDLGQAVQARACFEEALDLYRRLSDRAHEAAALNALGLVALEAGDSPGALELLLSVLRLREPGSRGEAVTLTSVGVAYRQSGRLPEARRAYQAALPVFRRLGDPREEGKCLCNLGWLEIPEGRGGPALEDFERGIRLFRDLADPPHLAWCLRGKAEALRLAGDLPAARQAIEEGLEEVERQRAIQVRPEIRSAFLATQLDHYEFLIDLLMEMHRERPGAGHDAEALAASERALARSLVDALAAGGADPGRRTAPRLLAREREQEAALRAMDSRRIRLALDPATTPEELRRADGELERGWSELGRLRARLNAANPRYADLVAPRPWSAPEIERRLLDRDTLLLEYHLGEKRSYLWAVSRSGLASFELPGRAAIERVATPACQLVARGGGRAAPAAGVQLARLGPLLLGPVAGLLPGKRLVVVGDGVIRYVPFAALPDPGGGEPLIAGHEIVTLPSASVLGLLRREVAGRPPAPKTLWVLADPELGRGFAPLPYSRLEAEEVLGLVPPHDRLAVLGPAANRDAVLAGRLRDYRFLHFATHGLLDAGGPGGSRLVLAQLDAAGRPVADGFLRLDDIYGLDLRADLVTLSACRSALGRELQGEGLVGMTRGFLYAGAERVLVSLWNVDDRASAELMDRFYRGVLRQGLSPAAALRAAQDAVRREPRWQAPYFWAGFVLQGEWRPLSATLSRAGH